MPYLGNEPAVAYTSTTKDSFSGDGSTTDFTMSKSANVNAVRVVVENVVQNPTVAYTCSGTTIAFTSAPPTGTNNIYVVHLGPPAATVAPPTTINNATTFTADLTVDDGADIITASAGTDNVRLGEGAGAAIVSGGNHNVTIGKDAGTAISTGDGNIVIGHEAGNDITTGSYNTGIGWKTIDKIDTGNSNVAVGDGSLSADTKGSKNVAIGSNALNQQNFTSATDSNNTAVGYNAGQGITTGAENTFVGAEAGDACIVGNGNVAVGVQALSGDDNGSRNTAVGTTALKVANATGSTSNNFYNVAFGFGAGITTTEGYYNTFLGSRTGESHTTGLGNTFVGYNTGNDTTTGSYNVLIGQQARADSASGNTQIVICSGTNYVGKGANTGFIQPNTGGVYQGNNSTTWSTTSDQRLKKNIVDSSIGLAEINQLKIRNFEYKTKDELSEIESDGLKENDIVESSGLQVGVIAQEIKEVLPKCVKEETTGVLSVDADNLTWHMIKAMQELSAKNDALETENTAIKARLDALEAG